QASALPSHPVTEISARRGNTDVLPSLVAITPSSTTPNQGKTGTRSLVTGGSTQKPSQEKSFSLNSGWLKNQGGTMNTAATRALTQTGANRKGSAISMKSAMAWSTPK